MPKRKDMSQVIIGFVVYHRPVGETTWKRGDVYLTREGAIADSSSYAGDVRVYQETMEQIFERSQKPTSEQLSIP